MTRTPLRLLVLLVTAALAAVLAPAGAASAAPYCGITWGSLAKSGTHDPGADTLRGVRAGRHECFDRLVVTLANAPGFSAYRVRYDAVERPGSGTAIPLRGAADLEIGLASHAYDGAGRATFAPANRNEVVDVSGFRTFRQVAWGGSYEGRSTLGLGVRAKLPFRVFVLAGAPGYPNGARVVIDVAHAW
jgi:hypothetical protein